MLNYYSPNSWNNKKHTILDVIQQFYQILKEPDTDCYFNDEVFALFQNNKSEYEKTAKEWTLKYASHYFQWKSERVLWIAYKKNDNNPDCLLAQMPKDIISHIISFVQSTLNH